MDEREDYFDYVSQVLGVKNIFISPGESLDSVPLLIVVENLAAYSAEEKELLDKMVTALKQDPSQIKIADMASEPKINFEFVVRFVSSPQPNANENQLNVFSPQVLLNKPELKKQVWSDMQNVIKYFAKPDQASGPKN